MSVYIKFIVIAAFVVLSISACGARSLKGSGDDAVERGLTVEVMKKVPYVDPHVWEKPSYFLPNGNAVYIEPIMYERHDRIHFDYINCDYHWEVNPQGQVVGYHLVGLGCCKHASSHDALFCDQSHFQDPRLRQNPEIKAIH